MVCVTLEGLWMISDKIVDFRFFVKFQMSRTFNIFQFLNYHRACSLCIKKAPNQGKDLTKMGSVTLEVLWMISDRIVDFHFFCGSFTDADLQISSIFELPRCMLVMHPKSS